MPKLDPNHVGTILAAYLDQEVIPKATGLQKVGAIMVGTIAAQKSGQMVKQYTPALKFADVMDEAGMIDLDKAYALAKDAFQKPGKVPVMGLLLDDGDVEIIHEIAKRYAQ